MAAGGFFECAPAAQAVRRNRRSGGQPVLGAARDLALAEALDRRQLQLARAPLGTGRDRRHEGRFARRAAAPLAAGAHPAEIGVVHLDPPRKRRLPLAPRHHRHDLVLHGPGRRLLDPETAAEFHRRDAVFRRHDQVDGGKPECQRQLGRVEDRARRGRCLLLAPVALIETPTRQHAMLPMAAAGADKAARPAQMLVFAIIAAISPFARFGIILPQLVCSVLQVFFSLFRRLAVLVDSAGELRDGHYECCASCFRPHLGNPAKPMP